MSPRHGQAASLLKLKGKSRAGLHEHQRGHEKKQRECNSSRKNLGSRSKAIDQGMQFLRPR